MPSGVGATDDEWRMTVDLRIEGRTYVVTGGSSGIGRGAVNRLVQEGANVVTCARGGDSLDAALRDIDPTGQRTLGISLDLREPEAAVELHDRSIERFGRVDGIVNNVGTSFRAPFHELDDGDWLRDMDIKLFPAIRLIQAALPAMRQRRSGSIVNVLSIGGKQPGAKTLPTSLTRAAGMALTKALSKELAADDIRVNAVCVGFIRSGQHDRRWEESGGSLSRDEWYAARVEERGVPMQRPGEPGEVASMIALLLSDLAGFTTGTAVNIDGGQAAVV